MSEDAIHELLGELYDAAYDHSKWREHLEILRSRTGAATAYLVSSDPSGVAAEMLDGPLASPEFNRKYRDYYYRIDEYRLAYYRSGIGTGQLWGSHQLIPDAHFAASEIYNDLLHPHDCFYVAGGTLFQNGPSIVAIGVGRGRRQGPPDDEFMRLLAALIPHQQKVLLINSRLRQLEAGRCMAGELIDCLPYGLIALDRRRRILTMNRVAEEIVLAGAGLRLGRKGLAGLRPREESALQKAIGRALAATPAATILALERPSSLRPLRIIVAPVPPSAPALPFLHPTPAVLLFLHDPERRTEPPGETLRWLYDLTPREAQLAALLAGGTSLDVAAAILGVTRRTAAGHLAQIFRKTGAHRQAELIGLLASIPNIGGFYTGEA